MNRKQKSITYLIPCIIIIVIAIIISLVFVFNHTDTKEYDNKLKEAQKYVEEMDYKRAETAYLQAIKIDSKQTKAYVEVADVYLKQNKIGDFIDVLEKGIKCVDKKDKKTLENKLSKVDNQTKANSFYSKKFKSYLKKYGTINEKYVSEDSDTMYLRGLCDAKLLDFNNDGVEEFILVYLDQKDKDYHFDIYGYDNNKIKHLESSKSSLKSIKTKVVNNEYLDELYGHDGGAKRFEIYQQDKNFYIRTGSTDDFEISVFHGYTSKNTFGIKNVLEFSEENYIKNKENIDFEAYDQEKNSYKEYYSLDLTQYEYFSNEERDTKGMNFALKDIKETMNKLGIKTKLKASTDFSQEKLDAYLESIKQKIRTHTQEQNNDASSATIDENKAIEIAKSKYPGLDVYICSQESNYNGEKYATYNGKQYFVVWLKNRVDGHVTTMGQVFVSSDGLEVRDDYWYDQSTGKVSSI